MTAADEVQRWGVCELDLSDSPVCTVIFEHDEVTYTVDCFERAGRRLARFSPGSEGHWSWRGLGADDQVLVHGTLRCTPPAAGDHGPVVICDELDFRHADGTPHPVLATSALWWHRESSEQRAATVSAVAAAGFSRVRVAVQPPGEEFEPDEKSLDQVEDAVRALGEIGVGAELVLFSGSGALLDDPVQWPHYLRRVVARFAAFANVWWCVAVDADRMEVPDKAWDDVLRQLAEADSGRHPRSIQAGIDFDHGRRLLTHCSLRHDQPRVCSVLTARYRKPVLIDDIGCERDGADPGADRTAEDLVADIWEAVCRGGSAAHGESFESSWSLHGGTLAGEAAPRVALLRELLDAAPPGLRHAAAAYDASTLEIPGRYYLQYLGAHRFRTRRFRLPDDGRFRVEVLDTWNLEIEEVASGVSGECVVELPDRLYNAIRIVRC